MTDLMYVNTGERLNATSFAKYRKEGGLIIINSIPEQAVLDCLQSPLTLMGSDALRGHPRAAGACARVLGHYVRERDHYNFNGSYTKNVIYYQHKD